MTDALKRVRNALSDAAAAAALRSPAHERRFIQLASLLVRSPNTYGLARRAMQTLSARLRETGNGVRPLNVGRVRFQIDVTGDVLRELYWAGIACEPLTTAWMLAHVPAHATVIDVGANVGYYTLLAAGLVGLGGRVVAFEPNPVVRAQLAAHVRVNGVQDIVSIEPTALADIDPGDQDLFVPDGEAESGLASLARGPLLEGRRGHAVQVRCERLDDWIDRSRTRRIDVIKIDVEGGEAQVVAGMRRALEELRPGHIVCETTWDGPAHRTLAEAGYAAEPLDWFDRGRGMANVLFRAR